MEISSTLVKRLVCAAVIVAVGVGSVIGYNYYLKNEDSLPVLGPITSVPTDDPEDEVVTVQREDITFSHTDSFYEESIEVSLTARDKSATIYYTTDGNTPTEKSSKYTDPIPVKSGSKVKAFTIKAIAVSDEKTSDVITRSYITGKGVSERFTDDTLVFVLSADEYDLYDYEHGIAVAGAIRDEWLANEYDGRSEIKPTDPANWNQEGMAGERPMYVEVFDSKGNRLLSQAAGARVAGAYSRGVDQKSWKLIARQMYSPDNGTFKYSFFDDAVNINDVLLTKFDRIVLRNGANDREFAGVRDELSGELARQSGFPDTQSATPAAVFLNGEYYGYSWLHQNYCKGYLESVYGGNKDNYQIVGKAEGNIKEENAEDACKDYNDMLELCKSGLTDDKNFEKLCSLVDIDNYMRYIAIQIFIDNRDWPGNNYKAWRYIASEGEEIQNEYQDGRWRYLLFDAEFAWGLYSDGYKNRTLSRIIEGTHPAGSSEMIKALMERADMREKLANNLCDLIDGAFSTENILKVLEEKLEISDPEQMYALKNGYVSAWANTDTFNNSRNEIRDFAKNRSKTVYTDLAKRFEIDKDSFYKVTLTGAKGLTSTLNTRAVQANESVTTSYFTPYKVTVSVTEHTGYEVDHIEVNGKSYEGISVVISSDMADADGNVKVRVVSKKTKENIPLYISEVYTGGDADWIELYNPNDEAVNTKGLYLTDKESMPDRWEIPATAIPAHSAIVVVCKNNKDASALLKLQTNFNLKVGETLILSDGKDTRYSSVVIVKCKEDESQRRDASGRYVKATPTMGTYDE